MKKVVKMVLMLCLVLSGALCYAHGAARTENQKGLDGVPINLKKSTGLNGLDKSNSIIPTLNDQQDSQGNKFLSFQFPSHIRNLHQHTINNTFGDAVFILVRSDLNEPEPKE